LRENIVRQARSIKGPVVRTAIAGIVIETGPDNRMAYRRLPLQRWSGLSWDQFGPVLSADAK
jgi:branched-chain amino acid transport system substrate-binding protein